MHFRDGGPSASFWDNLIPSPPLSFSNLPFPCLHLLVLSSVSSRPLIVRQVQLSGSVVSFLFTPFVAFCSPVCFLLFSSVLVPSFPLYSLTASGLPSYLIIGVGEHCELTRRVARSNAADKRFLVHYELKITLSVMVLLQKLCQIIR